MRHNTVRIFYVSIALIISVFTSASAFGQTADTLSYESTAQQEAQAMQKLQPPALSNESSAQQNGQATEEIQIPALNAPGNRIISQQEDITSLAQTGNSADASTILQVYKDATGLNKTPLILIHGIHGSYDWNQNGIINPSYASYDVNGQYYWEKFNSYFDGDAGLNSNYKLYIFSYLSDRYPVKEIARSLKSRIDTAINSGWMKDGKVVLLAHSMGGLVARSYMDEYNGGERIEKLITLATPHHGTPGANELAREHISTDIWFSSAMGIVDLAYWTTGATKWHPDAPNRSDLRWDNYDYRMSGTCWSWDYAADVDCYNNPLERNQWLQDLNMMNTSYDSNIIAYYGYIYLNDPSRTRLIAQINNFTVYGALISAYLDNDDYTNLRVANILMSEGMNNYYLYNDGLVPYESAEFNQHTVAGLRECAGYDHLDMKDGNTTVCSTGKNLFNSVKDDLYALALPNLTPYQPSGWSDKIVVATTASATIDSSTIYTTDNLYVSFAIANDSSSNISTPFYTALYVDGVGRSNISPAPSLNAGYITTYTGINIGTLSAGTHTLKIVTDSTGAVSESNETDNEYSKTITVAELQSICAGTLSSVTGELFNPVLPLGDQYYWVKFQKAQAPSGELMFKLTGIGQINNPADFNACQTSTLYASGNNYILHVPEMIFNGFSYRFDMQYFPTTDGLIWFKEISIDNNRGFAY